MNGEVLSSESEMERALVKRVTRQELARWEAEDALRYHELLCYCRSAMKTLEALLSAAGEELLLQYGADPIEELRCGLKSPELIADGLLAEGAPLTARSIEERVADLAQVRVVCSFLSDVYRVADKLARQDAVRLLERADHAAEPGGDGYRGLHLIVSVPVSLNGRKREIRVQVVLRTPAMELWAASERRFRRQPGVFLPEQISRELRACASLGAEWDQRMEQVRYNVEHRVITK